MKRVASTVLNVVCTSRVLTSVTRHSPQLSARASAECGFSWWFPVWTRPDSQDNRPQWNWNLNRENAVERLLFLTREREMRYPPSSSSSVVVVVVKPVFDGNPISLSFSLDTSKFVGDWTVWWLHSHVSFHLPTCGGISSRCAIERERKKEQKTPWHTPVAHLFNFLILIFSARSGILFFSINPETVKYKPNHTHTDTHSKWRWVLKKKKKKKKEPTMFWLCRCRPPRDDDDPSPSNAAAALGARKMLYKTKMSAHWATERYPVHLGDSALLVWAVTYTKSWPLLRRRRRRRRRLISPDTMLFFILYAYLNVLLLLLVYLPVLNSRQTL